MRACIRQHKAGKLHKKDFVRFKRAAYSGMVFVVKGKDGEADNVGNFLTHLRRELININPAAQGFFDELDFGELFNGILNWLIENWDQVLGVLLMLLVFIEAAEESITE